MIGKNTCHRAIVAAVALTLSSWTACAGNIAIQIGEGNAPALLMQDANAFTDAMGRALSEKTSTAPTRKVFAVLRSKVQGATLARIEYTYEKNGVMQTRVYHGHSGHSLQTIIERASSMGGGVSTGSESTSPDSSVESDVSDEDDIGRDAAEAKYYPTDTDTSIRAPKLREDTSMLEASVVDDRNHSWDAELKTLRKIEADIQNEVVPAGGRVTGYVSKSVCESCREVIDTFARVYNAEGTIYELVEPGADRVVDDASTTIARSRRASAELLDSRKAYAKANLSREAYQRPRRTMSLALNPIEKFETEEVATEEAQVEVCSE